jgi:hypothetical protein
MVILGSTLWVLDGALYVFAEVGTGPTFLCIAVSSGFEPCLPVRCILSTIGEGEFFSRKKIGRAATMFPSTLRGRVVRTAYPKMVIEIGSLMTAMINFVFLYP